MTREAKGRLSATVDAGLLAEGKAAVAAGRAESFSAWVNEGLARQVAHDRRMQALDVFLADYEAEHGPIGAGEIEEAGRRARARAVVVRGAAPGGAPARRATARRGVA